MAGEEGRPDKAYIRKRNKAEALYKAVMAECIELLNRERRKRERDQATTYSEDDLYRMLTRLRHASAEMHELDEQYVYRMERLLMKRNIEISQIETGKRKFRIRRSK